MQRSVCNMSKRLPVSHYLKNLKLIERNREWLSSNGISSHHKVSYYGNIFASYAFRRHKIIYLGNDFYYDNPATPLNLQNYPFEITKKILANMDRKPKSVLDLGGNIGQFSVTINHILKGKAKIDSFEPNEYAAEFLKNNTKNMSGIRVFNYGLGAKSSEEVMYFDPTRSGIGSLMKSNAGEGKLIKQRIKITNDVPLLTKRSHYDLVKIDVEGYEMNALKGLQGLTLDYLFIEISGQGRSKDYMHSTMFNYIRKQWGEFDIYYCGGFTKHSETFDLVLKIKK